jgi:hypothetical protein
MALESIISIASMASDQRRPALPKGWPLKISSTSPNGTPDQTGNNPGRINRHASIIISPSGGNNGCTVMMGSVVTIENKTTDAIGMASIFSVDCSRSKRVSYSRPGRIGRRSAVTGFFTLRSLASRRQVPQLAGLRVLRLGSFLEPLHKACWKGRRADGPMHRRWSS